MQMPGDVATIFPSRLTIRKELQEVERINVSSRPRANSSPVLFVELRDRGVRLSYRSSFGGSWNNAGSAEPKVVRLQ